MPALLPDGIVRLVYHLLPVLIHADNPPEVPESAAFVTPRGGTPKEKRERARKPAPSSLCAAVILPEGYLATFLAACRPSL